jgi:SAM-dependent methyltransferase
LLRVARPSGATVIAVDIHPDGIRVARQEAARGGLSASASFELLDAQEPLPFDQGSVDAIMCIDAINHPADRLRVLREWSRVLRLGGRLLFTDPAMVTGPLPRKEISVRSSIGSFQFVPAGTGEHGRGRGTPVDQDSRGVDSAGADRFEVTRPPPRAKRAVELACIEGAATFEGRQQ